MGGKSAFLESLESRCLLSGALVSSFGTGGQLIGDPVGNYVDPDKLIPFGNGGAFVLKSDGDLTRLLPNGSVDTRFADGSLDAGIGGVTEIATASDGSVYVEATDASGSTLQHYLKTGRLDRTFGDNGHLDLASFASIGAHGGGIGNLVVAPDGSLYCEVVIGGTDPDDTYSLYHIPADGDKTKVVGTVVTNSNEENVTYNQIIVGSTGDVFLLASGAGGVTAYNSNLKLLTTFGTDGVALSGQDLTEGVIDSSGRLTVIGASGTTPELVRLLPDGKLDTTFGTKGSVTLPSGGQIYSTGRELVLEPDGSYIVDAPIQNSANNNEIAQAGLREYDANGQLKSDAFGRHSDGVLTSTLGKLLGDAEGIIAAPDGDIYLASLLKYTLPDGKTTDSNFLEELTGT